MDSFQRVTVDGVDLIALPRKGAEKTIVMLHGFGANSADLAPLEVYLDPHKVFNWIFPNGILSVDIGPHASGRAWFPIRMADIEAAAMRGQAVDFADILPDGMKAAEERLLQLFDHLKLSSENLILGGFSQGAMMAVQATIQMKRPLRGMVLFSGTLINQKEWKQRLPDHASVPFFQSHGKRDPILGYTHAERLNRTLLDAGLKGSFMGFDGYHEIPLPVIRRAAEFLTTLNCPKS